MTDQRWLQIIGGLGIFIYSLRLITNALDETAADTLRKAFKKPTSRSSYCVLIGFLTTLFFQESSTTVLMSMGLLNRSLLNLEQATLIMLGATIGTTMRAWFQWNFSTWMACVSILISTVGILSSWKSLRLRAFEILFGVGLTILGMQLLTTGLSPVLESHFLLKWVQASQGNTFSQSIFAALAGAVLTVLFQSSGSVVALIIGLSSKGLISFEGAGALILGANVGSCSTALLLSIGQSVSAKRLALMHLIAKSFGVLCALLFYRTFLSTIHLAFSGLPVNHLPEIELAAIHTGFNWMNSLFWWTFLPVLIRIGRRAVPDGFDSEYWLSSLGVQKLLSRIPEKAVFHARKEVQDAVRDFSQISLQSCKLIEKVWSGQNLKESEIRKQLYLFHITERRLKNVEEVITRTASRWGETASFQPQIFTLLEKVQQLNSIVLALKNLLNFLDHSCIQTKLAVSFETFEDFKGAQEEIAELWENFYQTLANEKPVFGGFIFKAFYKNQDHLTGIKAQKLHHALSDFCRELGTATQKPKRIYSASPSSHSSDRSFDENPQIW